ncbi:Pachytene checkpoint protein 2-like protein [Lachnellula hyalina]|uniref:Pachytene checkpoint protein 2-like protein n=1 Tax=Lachnellula hyalina TaxID=1316788 RepID=A0A8H8QWL5_9HELO|nr:Pachytene checkpoint protein 2-like protein [Lachnellula hyalina]TVY24089.1 Pachytene checkpoint protein 2-like protein [Lachnellula hyalina]
MAKQEEFKELSEDGGFAMVLCPSTIISTIFIEARISKDWSDICESSQLQEALQARLSSPDNSSVVEVGDDIMANPDASITLGQLFETYKDIIQSLKVVEYVGIETASACYTLNTMTVRLQAYQLYDTAREEDSTIPQAETSLLPHVRFDGQWDEYVDIQSTHTTSHIELTLARLVFESDLKGELIWMMTNILRFSQKSGADSRDVNPLILLYGPPGTGKTTLCQGLAQKISIRLNSTYKQTKLIQIKTANLLSKYYSESAKQVDNIFTTIARMCQDDPKRFICVMIDEVESIAFSREHSTYNGEAQDSLRATNSLLTGLDRAKGLANVIFLCTSNMVSSLDTAFLDRCGLRIAVNPPSSASQYAILCGRIQKLIDRGHITSDRSLPLYDEADIEYRADGDGPGAKIGAQILAILGLINSGDAQLIGGISGRSLTQLPELAILRYLRGEDCDIDLALAFIKRFVLSQEVNG